MRSVVTVLFLLSCFTSFCQSRPAIYFLNNEKIDIYKVIVNPNNLKSMHVDKESDTGRVYMYSKKTIAFLTLDQVRKKYTTIESPNHLVYFVDGQHVKTIDEIRIDPSFHVKARTVSLSNVSYIKEDQKHMKLLFIDLLMSKKPNNENEEKGRCLNPPDSTTPKDSVTMTERKTFWTIKDVREKLGIIGDAKPAVYFVEDQLISNKQDLKIDGSYFIYAQVDSLDEMEYLTEEQRKLVVIRIELAKTWSPRIYIR